MSIANVNAAQSAAPIQNDLRSSSGSSSATPRKEGAAAAQSQQQIDEVTMQPKPPRFPWLSRLSQELESASKQRPSFPPAPELGDNLDQTA